MHAEARTAGLKHICGCKCAAEPRTDHTYITHMMTATMMIWFNCPRALWLSNQVPGPGGYSGEIDPSTDCEAIFLTSASSNDNDDDVDDD